MYLLTKCLPLLEERLIDWEDSKGYFITSNKKNDWWRKNIVVPINKFDDIDEEKKRREGVSIYAKKRKSGVTNSVLHSWFLSTFSLNPAIKKLKQIYVMQKWIENKEIFLLYATILTVLRYNLLIFLC